MKSLSNRLKSKNQKQGDDSDNEENEENEAEDQFNTILTAKTSESAWSSGGQQRDHIIQVLLNLISNFGVYHSTSVDKDKEEFQEVFFKSTYALENVNGLRQ